MLHGPSTAFSYSSTKTRKPRPYGHPTILVCSTCNRFVVSLTAPRTGRRVFVSPERFFANMALVYSWDKHGPAHFHRKKPAETPLNGVRSPTKEPAPPKARSLFP